MTMIKSRLLHIAIKTAKRQPMQQLSVAQIRCASGVDRDFRGKAGHRQVTVLDQAGWRQACKKLNKSLSWETRRANLLVEDLPLFETVGQYILIGQVVLKITQETDPCHRMDEAAPGLFDVLKENWWGGVCCRVIEEGEVKTGDEVQLLSREAYECRRSSHTAN